MKIRSFEEMLLEYQIPELEPDNDERERYKMLSLFKYSVILEGEFMEFENLDKWIKIYIDEDAVNSLFYGKTGYNYGFIEYFFDNETKLSEIIKVIPNIYTLYPNANPRECVGKSDGYDSWIDYNSEDKNAVLVYQLD